ncbi:SWIM zinc finger family protein [Actinomadura rupiterrae]|uniref:SWIM zinc finger family protein n=1 Tax=Actinomadura rupiterrae TaxID=559627 RepID=UPI0020A23A48|nr:hypothetical protein [Actinomadura rupiterrae]MCP2342160.1 putative Zn finger protein [Actinomadura rupiterrae]
MTPVPWSRRFLDRLDSFGMTVRTSSVPAAVSDLTVTPGSVNARVRGSRRRPYDVWIDLPVYSSAEWTRVENAIAAAPDLAHQILGGELAPDVDGLFASLGLALLPARPGDLTLDCPCPGRNRLCVHVTAVLQSLADTLDDDPFVLLTWRGRTRTRLQERLHLAAPGATRPPQEDLPPENLPDSFWREAAPPRTPPPHTPPAVPALYRLDRPAITAHGRNLINLLEPAYEAFYTW